MNQRWMNTTYINTYLEYEKNTTNTYQNRMDPVLNDLRGCKTIERSKERKERMIFQLFQVTGNNWKLSFFGLFLIISF